MTFKNRSLWESNHILVLPAASRPSISRRISLDPKILPIMLDILLPIVRAVAAEAVLTLVVCCVMFARKADLWGILESVSLQEVGKACSTRCAK